MVNNKSKAFEEGKRAAWVSVWTLLGIGIAEVVISTTTGSLTLFADGLDSMAKDKSMSPSDRINAESIKLEAFALLREAIEASISSSDPASAREKITEHSSRRGQH